jgi:AcrR family transcriptional regulator
MTDTLSNQTSAATHDTARGASAREHMLQTALDLFGRHGFDATTTRMVAQAANMNLGAIPYYFGSKDELYAQAASYLADFIERKQTQPLAHLTQQAQQTTDPTRLIELLVDYLRQTAHTLLAEAVPASWVSFFLRAQAEHGQAFERIFSRAVEPVQMAITDVVARITQRSADDFETRTLAFLAFHQVMCFRLADTVLMRRLNWDELTPARVEQLLTFITQSLRAQLLAAAQTDTHS